MPTRRQLIGAGAASVALTAATSYPLRALAQDDDDDDDDDRGGGNRIIGTPTLQPAIDLIRAQEIALEGNPDAAVIKVELDGENGVLEYSVRLHNGVEVDIDATTGAIIRTEQSDDDNGDDDGTADNGGSGDDDGNDDDGGSGDDDG